MYITEDLLVITGNLFISEHQTWIRSPESVEVPALPEDQTEVVTQLVPLPPLLLQLRLVLDQLLGLAGPRLNISSLFKPNFPG